MITNIQRFSIHDGPGIRTTIFFKGCNLRCFWCHNPETQNPKPQLQFFPQKCLSCGLCFDICPNHFLDNGLHKILRENCSGCGKCAELCYNGALLISGYEKTPEQIMSDVLKDKGFYEDSGGGVTLSGGEPLLQPELCRDLLILCKAEGINTVVDTAFHVSKKAIDSVIPYTDLFLIDIKHWDNKIHEKYTGVKNNKIFENINYIDKKMIPFIVRIPILPENHAGGEDQRKIADLIQEYRNIQYVELITLHKMGIGKYDSLGIQYKIKDLINPSRIIIEDIAGYLKKTLKCKIIY